MTQQSLEERVALLESKIAEYEIERARMRELAVLSADVKELHASQNEMREDLRLRIQATGSEIRDEIDAQADALRTEYHAGYTYLGEKINDVEKHLSGRIDDVEKRIGDVEEHLSGRIGDVEKAIGHLQVGQQQILDILLRKTKMND